MINHSHDEDFCLSCFMSEIDPLLPFQGPIKDFIAGTKVPLFVPHPFDEGLKLASSLYHSRSYMDLSYYREKYAFKEISDRALDESIVQEFGGLEHGCHAFIKDALHNYVEIFDKKTFYLALNLKKRSLIDAQEIIQIIQPPSFELKPTARFLLHKKLNQPMDHEVNSILFRLLGAYLDQGVNLWPFLDRYQSFKNAVVILATKSSLPLAPFINNADFIGSLQQETPYVITNLLGKILLSPKNYHSFLLESLLDHPGWSGMVNMIAKSPNSLAKPRPITLDELTAVKLALEWQFISNTCPDFSPLHPDEVSNDNDAHLHHNTSTAQSLAYWALHVQDKLGMPPPELLQKITLTTLQKTWHLALENTYYQSVAQIIISSEEGIKTAAKTKQFQAVFCLDDRECSFRRHLETESPEIETFGYAGFFGIDCYFKAHKKDILDKICPLPVTPHHLIIEKPTKGAAKNKKLVEFASFISLHGANSTFFGFISAYTIGHLSLFRLILSFLHPFKLFQVKQLTKQEKTTLLFQRSSDEQTSQGLYLGYREQEMADRVFSVLNNMGLRDNFSPLVFMIGHGSSSVNNPHFAAYDCGACSGRPGSVNSRVFAAMANLPAVRRLIQEKGISIPDSTHFVGGFHDTCTDLVTFFDTEDLAPDKKDLMKEFSGYIRKASAKNALERCKKFALAPKNLSPEQALFEVNHRARALFEPRPELGHATNALCIVGRRSISYQKNLDRRAFLQSYDPEHDPDGRILGDLLTAVIPVCGGISLEYMFSRIDPAIHGCGTKLSHNVCSLIGVGNGLDDDLRTGLPIQTTELHIPIRLLIVIEQRPDIIVETIYKNSILKPWLINGWVKVASLDKNSISMYDHQQSRFIDLAA